MNNFLHRIAHFFQINYVTETRVYEPHSRRVLVTLRCVGCEWTCKVWTTDRRVGEVTRRGGPCRRTGDSTRRFS